MNKVNTAYNWIDGQECDCKTSIMLDKYSPHTGALYAVFTSSDKEDVEKAILAAKKSYLFWSQKTPVERGEVLRNWVRLLRENKKKLASIIAEETGKKLKDAAGEVSAAILQGEYFAGEGMRLYARSLTSSMSGKYAHSVRQPIGVAALIVPANTPIANIAWKVFPALICGNTVVLKASEDAPITALVLAKLASKAGLADGVFNVVQGLGNVAGKALIEDERVSLISFTGSTAVGLEIAKKASERLARLSLELGGKNAFVVCEDADLEEAVKWAILSAFSNAGQRCAAASRILIQNTIYSEFIEKLEDKTRDLKLGIDEDSDLGPVINRRQQDMILSMINQAKIDGAEILCGGDVTLEKNQCSGYYVKPTLIHRLPETSVIHDAEIFGPVAILYKFADLRQAIEITNSSRYGLTAAIHTSNVDKAMWFAHSARVGTVNINIGTFGSEPHMPFGGLGLSGNGTREPGVEALDVYSELKNISIYVRETKILN